MTSSANAETRPLKTLFDDLIDRATRRRALETALVAYALTNPDAIPRQIEVSPTCALVLHAIFAKEYADPCVSLVACVVHHVAWEPLDAQRAAVGIAETAADVTVQDLASIGDLATVLDLLRAEQRSQPMADAA